jgi:DNA-binding NarL/FixJ family response regulator
MLTVYDDDARIFDAICAVACGYVLKNTPPARLLESLKDVMAGGAPMSPEVARRVIELFREIRPSEHADYHLTSYESRLLQLLVDGHDYKTAGAEVGRGVHAVSFHMRNIYEKLQVHSKAEARGQDLASPHSPLIRVTNLLAQVVTDAWVPPIIPTSSTSDCGNC